MGGGFSFLGRESEKRRTGKEGQGYLEIRPFHDGLGQKPTQLENKGNLEKGLKLDDLFFSKIQENALIAGWPLGMSSVDVILHLIVSIHQLSRSVYRQ